jgi:hypothetical protein
MHHQIKYWASVGAGIAFSYGTAFLTTHYMIDHGFPKEIIAPATAVAKGITFFIGNMVSYTIIHNDAYKSAKDWKDDMKMLFRSNTKTEIVGLTLKSLGQYAAMANGIDGRIGMAIVYPIVGGICGLVKYDADHKNGMVHRHSSQNSGNKCIDSVVASSTTDAL